MCLIWISHISQIQEIIGDVTEENWPGNDEASSPRRVAAARADTAGATRPRRLFEHLTVVDAKKRKKRKKRKGKCNEEQVPPTSIQVNALLDRASFTWRALDGALQWDPTRRLTAAELYALVP